MQLNSEYTLQSSDKGGHVAPASVHDRDLYRDQMRRITGGHMLPPVAYKGQVIPAREF
jgi:hypothetical protein